MQRVAMNKKNLRQSELIPHPPISLRALRIQPKRPLRQHWSIPEKEQQTEPRKKHISGQSLTPILIKKWPREKETEKPRRRRP
jgi:hypothetical protein